MKTLIIYGVLTGAIAVLAVSQYIGVNDDLYKSKLTYASYICDKAHNESAVPMGDPFGDDEAECGKLQQQTNTEYLCNKAGTGCWLELKG